MKTISAQDYINKYGQEAYQNFAGGYQIPQVKGPNIFDRIKQSIQETANRNVDIYQGTGEYQNQGNIRRGFELAGNTARGVFDTFLGVPVRTAGEALGGTQVMQDLVTNHPNLAGHIENIARPLANPVESAANQLSKSNFFQEAAQGIDQNPNSFAAKYTEPGLSIAANAGDVANLALAPEFAKDVGNLAKEKITNLLPKSTPKLETKIPSLTERMTEQYGKQIKADWERPAKTPNASYNKASEIYKSAAKRGQDIPDTLIKNKLDPQDLMENGRYQTADAAEKMRSDAMQTSKDLMRPSLEAADRFTPRTPLKEVFQAAVDNVKRNTKLTAGQKQTILKNIEKEYQALQPKYPEGAGLADMHDNQITYDANAKYSPVGDIATNNQAVANKAIADSFRKAWQTKAPEGIGAKQFQAELSKQFKAADYLDALNNKKAPVTIGSRIRNTMAKATGASVSYGLGGGVLGGVAGYHLGGLLESLLEGMPNPLRQQYLANLKITNPEAFTKISQFLQDELAGSMNRKALPAPSYMEGSPQTVPQSKMEVLPAEKQIYRDPKTGQMQRGYKSTSQSGFVDFGQVGKDINAARDAIATSLRQALPELHNMVNTKEISMNEWAKLQKIADKIEKGTESAEELKFARKALKDYGFDPFATNAEKAGFEKKPVK